MLDGVLFSKAEIRSTLLPRQLSRRGYLSVPFSYVETTLSDGAMHLVGVTEREALPMSVFGTAGHPTLSLLAKPTLPKIL